MKEISNLGESVIPLYLEKQYRTIMLYLLSKKLEKLSKRKLVETLPLKSLKYSRLKQLVLKMMVVPFLKI